MESAPTRPPPPSTPPPPPPEFPTPMESLTRRYRIIWRLLLISNLALGAYMFAGPKKKDGTRTGRGKAEKRKPVEEVPVTPDTSLYDLTADEPYLDAAPIAELVKVREPISEEQQRELFQWMLDEKRKLAPKDAEEKKKIDLDKALLKKFIRAKSVPEL